MDFWRTVLVLVRRWYVVVPVFVLSIGVAFAVYQSVPPVYLSNAVIALTTPTTGGSLPYRKDQPNPEINPLLNSDRGLSLAASLLIAALNAPDLATQLGAPPGGAVVLDVNNGTTNVENLANGPFVYISAEAPSAELAQGIVAKVSRQARAELRKRELQVRAPIATYIVMTDVVPATVAEAQQGRKSRPALIALVVGAMAALTAGFAAESFAVARRARRESAEQGPVEDVRPVERVH
ncbi:hypothetical protein ABT294_07855 [Nonomuraea sp. NPDC000554]|uniref:hypothetical protein n=1 Tax=Nonomuraea sp. NPDC000554 TaxID=3154259 RepID=UPI00331F0895